MVDYTSDGHIFNKTVTIIGIDPGASGAMSFTKLEWIGGKVQTSKIDSIKCHPLIAGRRVSISMAVNAFKSDKIIAYIEKVHAMPHDGRSSLFKFGVNYGAWLGILHSNNEINEIVEVSPQKWMKFWQDYYNIKLPKVKKERKAKLKQFANLYSSKVPTTLWNADSILIAQYGAEQEKERLNESREDI